MGRVVLLCVAVGAAVALGGWTWPFAKTPEDVVRESLEGLRSPTAETVEAALDPELRSRLADAGIGWEELFRALYGHLAYDGIVVVSEGEGEATVELDVTNVDVASVLDAYAETAKAVAEGEADTTLGAKALLELLEAEDAPTTTVHERIELAQVDGDWRLADPQTLPSVALCRRS